MSDAWVTTATDGGGDAWGAPTTGNDSWNDKGADADAGAAVGGDTSGGGWGGGDGNAGGSAGDTGDRLDKPQGGLTGECFNCGEVGHNKADCPNPKVERPYTGTCRECGEEGHPARSCPSATCKLCGESGHKALDCSSRRIVNWDGVPELESEEAWRKLIDAAKEKDLDKFRLSLRAYARSIIDVFDLAAVEQALREDGLEVYLIGLKQVLEPNQTIVDIVGNPGREFVLSVQLSAKPRRKALKDNWPENQEENLARLKSAGYVQDRGVPLCSNCNELGHIKKHCKQEIIAKEKVAPDIQCVYCQEIGHRARDCPKERVSLTACKNCKQEGHNAKDCPEPKSAENVTCRKCDKMGHFSRDCPEAPARTCRNCGGEGHISKECDQPRNPDTVTCRNCEKQGHFSKDCPEPKDWSKVKCSNCGEMGHTIKRCKVPEGEGAGGGAGGGWETNAGADGGVAAPSGWDNGGDTTAAGGEASWGTGGDSGW